MSSDWTLCSWNVNSVRARLPQMLEWLQTCRPDILLLQELKCVNEAFPYETFDMLGYNCHVHGQKSYNGVAILSKFPVEDVVTTYPGDPDPAQSRYIEALITLPSRRVARISSVYVPNGKSVDDPAFRYKLAYLEALAEHLHAIQSVDEALIIGGDFNVAHRPEDVYDPERLCGTLCFHPAEQAAFQGILHKGFHDSYRFKQPTGTDYSWWDYRARGWDENRGMRLDMVLVSPLALDHICDAWIDKTPRAYDRPSDHAPVCARFAL